MASNWILWEEKGGYYVWCRQDTKYNTVWDVTKTDRPPRHFTGYFDRESLYKLKGIENKA